MASSCATYYQKNEGLMNAVYKGNFEAAEKILSNDSKFEKVSRNRLLFYLNKGTVLWMNQKFDSSIPYFRKADYFVEDYERNYTQTIASFLTNKNIITYQGEDFEKVLIHYYGALNYLMLGNLDEALIEAKRMLLKMQKNTDKYKSNNKYKRDALAHNLLGIIYDAKREYNDAFIAYKNAYEVYNEDYLKMFGTPIPNQLKKDIIRTAYLSGFPDEQNFFENKFAMKFSKDFDLLGNSIIFFWNNGLGPIKDQNSINFSILPYGNGWVQIVNHDLGFSFPYKVDNNTDKNDLLDMRFFRVALPKYVSRDTYYKQASIQLDGKEFGFQIIEDINAIAFKSLNDRMTKELGEALLRAAFKQLAVYKAGKEKKDGLALAASIYGAISEQADTRNWQLLPSAIYYSRVPLNNKSECFTFLAKGNNAKEEFKQEFTLKSTRGMQFYCIQTIDFTGYSEKK
jgi:hypothetical protein